MAKKYSKYYNALRPLGKIIFFVLIALVSNNNLLHSQVVKRYALVIGNGNYENGNMLKNPVNDANLLSERLGECGFEVDQKENLSKRDFNEAVNKFYDKIRVQKCVALVYYSGHGIQYEGENYLIPIDADIRNKADIGYECMPLGKILGKLGQSASTTNIIVLDACRIDPFSKAWTPRGDGVKGLTTVRGALDESFIAFATAPDQIANDGIENNSPFCQALSKYIIVPGYTIEQVFKKVNVEVKDKYPSQIPWTSSSLGHEFYFIDTRRTTTGGTDTFRIREPPRPRPDPIDITMCTARCFTRGIIGVEVSFVDRKNNKQYSMVSNGENLEFQIPCYLLEQPIEVNFRRDTIREFRNVQTLADFEVPDLFK